MKTTGRPIAFLLLLLSAGCASEATPKPNERSAQAAQALVSSNVRALFLLTGTNMTIQTGDMPASWYATSFNDSLISVSWDVPASNCNRAASGSFSSDSAGNFNQVLDQAGETIGVWWSASHNLAGLEHRWHNFIACDGALTVIGCKKARTVTYSLSVGGNCTNGDNTCSVTGSVSLEPVRDADEVETNCPVSCSALLGACVSSCQSSCPKGSSSCSRCCECDCKDAVHEQNPSCPAPQASCYASKPNHPACL